MADPFRGVGSIQHGHGPLRDFGHIVCRAVCSFRVNTMMQDSSLDWIKTGEFTFGQNRANLRASNLMRDGSKGNGTHNKPAAEPLPLKRYVAVLDG